MSCRVDQRLNEFVEVTAPYGKRRVPRLNDGCSDQSDHNLCRLLMWKCWLGPHYFRQVVVRRSCFTYRVIPTPLRLLRSHPDTLSVAADIPSPNALTYGLPSPTTGIARVPRVPRCPAQNDLQPSQELNAQQVGTVHRRADNSRRRWTRLRIRLVENRNWTARCLTITSRGITPSRYCRHAQGPRGPNYPATGRIPAVAGGRRLDVCPSCPADSSSSASPQPRWP